MEKEVRNAINTWGRSLPNKSIKNFGDRISIQEVEEAFHDEFTLTNQYRSDKEEAYIAPYVSGKNIRDEYEQGDLRIGTGNFNKKTHQIVISGSEKIVTCTECNGKPSKECKSCRGNGKETCNSCKGRGEINCLICSGKGRVVCLKCGGARRNYVTDFRQVYVNGQYQNQIVNEWRSCDYCGGSGYSICEYSGCSNGKIDCLICSGHGQKYCSSCGGVGEIYCSKCKGSGHRTSFTLKTSKVDFKKSSSRYEPSEFSSRYPTFRHPKENTGNTKLDKVTQSPNRDTHNDKGRLCVQVYKELFSKLNNSSNVEVDSDYQIIFNRFVHVEYPIYEVKYEFEGAKYSLVFNKGDKSIHAEKVPDILNKKSFFDIFLEKVKEKKDTLWVVFYALIAITMIFFIGRHVWKEYPKRNQECSITIITTKSTKFYSKPDIKSKKLGSIEKNDTLNVKCNEYKYFYEIDALNKETKKNETQYVFKEHTRKIE